MSIKEFWEKYKKDIIFIGIIIILILVCIFSINSCQKQKERADNSEHNVEALTSDVEYYKAKNGQLVAESKILIGDKETLEIANKELSEELKNMKVKNWEQAIQIKGLIENPPRDTVWKIDYTRKDTTAVYNFSFSDKYRLLDGFVAYNQDNVLMKIEHDKTYFDYTLAVKDGELFLTSTNPYVQYESATGITVPKKTKKHWGFTVTLGIGAQYGLINKKFDVGPQIGIGGSYIF